MIDSIIAQDNIYNPEYKEPRPTTPKSHTKVSTYPSTAYIGNVIIFTTKPGQNRPIAYRNLLSRSYYIAKNTPAIIEI